MAIMDPCIIEQYLVLILNERYPTHRQFNLPVLEEKHETEEGVIKLIEIDAEAPFETPLVQKYVDSSLKIKLVKKHNLVMLEIKCGQFED